MKPLYTLGHSQCRLQNSPPAGAYSTFASCSRFVFVLLLLLGGVMQGVDAQYSTGYPQIATITDSSVELVVSSSTTRATSYFVVVEKSFAYVLNNQMIEYGGYGVYDVENDVYEFSFDENMVGNVFLRNASTLYHGSISSLLPSTNYILYVVTKKTDYFEATPTRLEFTTLTAVTPPSLNTFSPTNGASDVSLSPTLSMTFNEAVSLVSGKISIFKAGETPAKKTYYADQTDFVKLVNGGLSVEVSASGLEPGSSYYVTVDPGFVKSSASGVDFEGIAGTTTWTFTTGTAPQLVAVDPLSPASGATGVALDAILTARFDQSIRFNTSTDVKYIYIVKRVAGVNTIVASYPLGSTYSVPPSLSIDAGTNSLIINGESDYEYGTDYSVYIESGAIESSIGIPFSGLQTENSWAFRTLDPPAPVGTMVTPAAGDLNISILTDVVINYDMAIRNLDGSAITDANVKSLINIYQGSVAPANIIPSTGYTATIAVDKKSITVRLAPGSYFNPNSDINVVIGKVENNQGFEQNLEQIFTFHTGVYNSWTGTTDSDWTKVSNWGGTYTEGASVIIKSSANGAVLNSNLSIPNMIIAEGGKLTINPGATLTVNSFFRMYSVNGSGTSASLVVNGTLSTVPSKTFIYQGITNYDYDYYISSPVTGAQKSVVAPAGSVFEYNVLTGKYVELSSGSILSAGKGYSGYAPAGSSFAFSGAINQLGSYQFDGSRNTVNYGWNLAGNPYPCAVDLALTYNNNGFANLKPHVYLRDNVTQQLYAWNFPAGVGTADGPQIPSMHAFWVQVAIGQPSGSLTMHSADRVHNTKNYHKSASATPVQKPTVKLFAQNGAVKDLSVITFIPGNDDAYDDYDSEKRFAMNSSVTDLYTVKDGKRLVINSFCEYNGSKEVPIGVYAKKAGTYTLGLASLAGFDQEVELKLVDYSTSPATTHDLSLGDYSFTVAGNIFIDHRFVLQVSNKVATGVDQPEANSEVTIYAFQSDVVIENKGDAVGQYTIYDLSGRVITSGEVGAFSKVSVPMPVKGVVLGEVKTYKGVVNKKLLIQ
ncbi:MAG: Ig-like domain-containing protein [Breznakibacter sp.]|nr:Ig-like domain-containing protein [Breznakibacter sp.]